jgi:hypothetical protein
MSNQYSFTLNVVDLATGTMKNVTGTTTQLSNEVEKLRKKNQDAGNSFKQLANVGKGNLRQLSVESVRLHSNMDKVKQKMRELGSDGRGIEKYTSLLKRQEEQLTRVSSRMAELQRKMNNTRPSAGGRSGGGRNGGGFGEGLGDSLGGALPMGLGMRALTNPYLAGGALVGGGLIKGVQNSLNFDDAMGNINTTARLEEADRKLLGDFIRETANRYGTNDADAARAFEAAISATNSIDKSKDMLDAVLLGTKSLRTDAGTVARGLSYLSNTIKGSSPMDNLDLLVASRQQGAGEAGDFAKSLPSLLNTGLMKNNSVEEIAGMFSAFTRQVSTSDAEMLTKNLLSAFSKPDTKKALNEMLPGGVYNKDDSSKSLPELLKKLAPVFNNATGKQRDKILETLELRDMQAIDAFSQLITNVEQLDAIIASVKNREGQAVDAAEKGISNQQKLDEALNRLGNQMSVLGDKLAPIVADLVTDISDSISWLNQKVLTPLGRKNDDYNMVRDNVGYGEAFSLMLSDMTGIPFTTRESLKQTYGATYWDGGRGVGGGDWDAPTSGSKPKSAKQQLSELTSKMSGNELVDKESTMRGIIVNIEKIIGVQNQSVGSGKEAGQLVGDEILRALNKVLRDAQVGAVGGGR